MLKIEDLYVEIDGQEIVKGLDLEVGKGEIHAIMGPNGSGKSTLANVLMGHPRYEVTEGSITFQGEDVFELEPDERAKLGMFLAFQYPSEVPGVSVANFLRTAVNSVREDELSPMEMYRLLQEKMSIMQMDPRFAERYLNEGFSGGEKKRNEILQMLMLDPKLAIMDETDSGLDIDALQVVAKGVNEMKGPEFSAVIITHYQRILRYIEPDRVHVMLDGRLVTSGGKELADDLEGKGRENAGRQDYTGARPRRVQVRFPRSGGVLLQDPEEGYRPGDRGHDLQAQERAGVDARVPAEGAGVVPREADPDLGRRPLRDGLRRHLLLHKAHGEPGPLLGRCARRHKEHLREARHPAGREGEPGRRRGAVRVRGRLPLPEEGARRAGRHLPGYGLWTARARGHRRGVLRYHHPAGRQQVRGAELRRVVGRLVRVHPASGVLPHQRGEHGPVRADAHHRRRGFLRALHRGLHGTDVYHELAALGGSRVDR